MKFNKQLPGLSAIALMIAGPGWAAIDDKNITCEVTVEDGKIIKKGDCENAKSIQMDIDDIASEDIQSIRVERLENGDGAYNMFFSSDEGDSDTVMMKLNTLVRNGTNGRHKVWVNSTGAPGGLSMWNNWMDDKWDTDGDGTVSVTEIKKAKIAELVKYDSNRDGSLSLDEYQTLWMAKQRNRMVDQFQALDEDGDAQVTKEEFAAKSVQSSRIYIKIENMKNSMQKKLAKEKKKSKK